jgi:hypothetical protein
MGGDLSVFGYFTDPMTGTGMPVSSTGSAQAHLFMLGTGLELTVPYFHFSVGYQFAYAFYARGLDASGQISDDLGRALRKSLDGNWHGWTLEVGCAF